MGNNKKIRIYFDYNIYDSYSKGEIELNLENLKKYFSVYLSVAILEEYYRAEKNSSEATLDLALGTKDAFGQLNYDKNVLCPGDNRIICEKNSAEERLEIIKKYDTQNYIAECSEANYGLHKEIRKKLVDRNRSVVNYSNIFYKEIWNKEELQEYLEEFPEEYEKIKTDCIEDLYKLYGVNARKEIKMLEKKEINLQYGMFKKNDYPVLVELQITIEYLYFILEKCGYHAEKKKTANSSIYDVSHIIYASYCDLFITNDGNLVKKANAIYYFLGIKTKAMKYDDFLIYAHEYQ